MTRLIRTINRQMYHHILQKRVVPILQSQNRQTPMDAVGDMYQRDITGDGQGNGSS